jgi:hypothetical protein
MHNIITNVSYPCMYVSHKCVNVLLQMLSFGVMVTGCIAQFAAGLFYSALESVVDRITGAIEGADGFHLSSLDLASMLGGAAVRVIIVGMLISGTAVLGLIGVNKKKTVIMLVVSTSLSHI